MKNDTDDYTSIAYTCVSLIVMFLFIGVGGCASVPQQPTTIDCPSADASGLQGVVKGTWKGMALNAAEVYGEFKITISPDGKITGNYTGSAFGDIAGCVDAKGNLQASGTGSGGKISWMGRVSKIKDTVYASGTWEFPSGNGTWSGQR